MQCAETAQGPAEEAQDAARALLGEACHRLWKNLKTLPQAGKKVQQQLKRHLPRGPAPDLPQSQNVYTDLPLGPAVRDTASGVATCAAPAEESPPTSRLCDAKSRDSASAPCWVPEEYGRPPPFAPGFS